MMKHYLLAFMAALTMCGCKYYAIRSVDVLDDPEFIVVPTETRGNCKTSMLTA